jgi:hypothetical protein
MKFETIEITPDLAKRLLQFNTGNRKINRGNVNYWKSAIIGGAVSISHQGIALAGTILNPIRIIDGQHRLVAIVETGISCPFVVASNVPIEAFKNLDNGMPRSLADRANITPKEAQMANAFYYYIRPGRNKAPVNLILEIHDQLKPHLDQVSDHKKRALSIIAIRSAFVLQQKTQGFNYSDDFQNGRFSALPESMNALYRRQSTNPIGVGGESTKFIAFCAAWRAITRPSLSRVHTSNNPSEEASAIIASQFPELCEIVKSYYP